MATLTDVKAAQPEWFSKENKRYWGDLNYRVLHGGRTKRPYLVRSTFKWSDMFGQQYKRLNFVINPLGEDLTIMTKLDVEFRTYTEVKDWLEDN